MRSAEPHRRHPLAAAVLVATALAVTLTLAVPANTQAAHASSGSGTCAGHKVRTLRFTGGAVHVYRNGTHVCALTRPKRAGTRRTMSVSVQARGSRPVVDRGRYTVRAGPVTVHAGHRCVRLKGSVGSGSVSTGWLFC